ncbi:MAG: polysaccharide biosynthesis/export family protein [Verrucomicrobia bacterium]|nr:polysaccharide biosynthesis/export family protein [Verrucomicrobiota bacterium]
MGLIWISSAGLEVQAQEQTREPGGFLPMITAEPAVAPPPTNTPAPNTTSGYVLDDKRRLLPGDRVSFQILEDRTNAVSLLVTESTELDIPYIGRLNVEGRTCRELAEEIKTLLEKDYYYRATVIIGLDALAKVLGKVYVWGPVRIQGPIDIPANEVFTAGKAILRAGGFGDFANKKDVRVVRKTPTGTETFKVNMIEVFEKGNTDADVVLQPEDFIIVPQRAINF